MSHLEQAVRVFQSFTQTGYFRHRRPTPDETPQHVRLFKLPNLWYNEM